MAAPSRAGVALQATRASGSSSCELLTPEAATSDAYLYPSLASAFRKIRRVAEGAVGLPSSLPLCRLARLVNSLAGAVIVVRGPSAAFCHADRPVTSSGLWQIRDGPKEFDFGGCDVHTCHDFFFAANVLPQFPAYASGHR